MWKKLSFSILFLSLASSAQTGDKKKPSIECTAQGRYVGNAINPVFSLTISDAKKKTWTFTHSDDYFGFRPPLFIRVQGTYELAGDLAIFTGTEFHKPAKQWVKKRKLRFGVNYGFHGKNVHFNRFFRTGEGKFGYHRKWFKKDGAEWRPVEERRFAFPAKALKKGAKYAKIPFACDRLQWDKNGEKTRSKFTHTVTFKRYDNGEFGSVNRLEHKWLPNFLRPHYEDARLVSVGIHSVGVTELRGFHPNLATAPN